MQCILYLIHFTFCKEMSFISLHTSHYPVPESSMLNVKRGWRDNENYKVFWFYVWVGKCVCTSPKWKSTKTGNRSSQTFLVVLKHPVNLSETISSVQRPARLKLKHIDNFLLGQKHIYVRDKNIWHELIYILILPLTEIKKKSPQTQHRTKLSKLSNQPFFSPRQIFDVEHLFELHQFD